MDLTDKPVGWAYEVWDGLVRQLGHTESTARHSLQALRRAAVAGMKLQTAVLDGLTQRFKECAAEKNCTLIRHDIIPSTILPGMMP